MSGGPPRGRCPDVLHVLQPSQLKPMGNLCHCCSRSLIMPTTPLSRAAGLLPLLIGARRTAARGCGAAAKVEVAALMKLQSSSGPTIPGALLQLSPCCNRVLVGDTQYWPASPELQCNGDNTTMERLLAVIGSATKVVRVGIWSRINFPQTESSRKIESWNQGFY